MYKNIILGSILVLFFSFQIATSLKCQLTTSPTKHESLNCTKVLAQVHTLVLSELFDVSREESDDFKCFSIVLTNRTGSKNSTTLRGCGFKSLACPMTLKEEPNKVVKSSDCNVCEKDNCNPAGRMYENLSLISISAVVALIVKAFN